VVRDVEVTDEFLATRDLILLGTPADNAVLARMAGDLPVKVSDGRVSVQADPPMRFAQDEVVFTLHWRNPLAKDRLIWWLGGFDDRDMVSRHASWWGPDLHVARKSDGIRIALADIVGNWRLEQPRPLTLASTIWPTDADLCLALASAMKEAVPADVVVSDVGLVGNPREHAVRTVGDVARMGSDASVLELTGSELRAWGARRLPPRSATTQPATSQAAQDKPGSWRGMWIGPALEQLDDVKTYRVLLWGDVVWSLGLETPVRLVRYVPAEEFEPVRDGFIGDALGAR